MVYFSEGNSKANLWPGRLKIPFGVFTLATLTRPSWPLNVCVTRPRGHLVGTIPSSCRTTTSPTEIFFDGLYHLVYFLRLDRYSWDHLCQKCLTKFWHKCEVKGCDMKWMGLARTQEVSQWGSVRAFKLQSHRHCRTVQWVDGYSSTLRFEWSLLNIPRRLVSHLWLLVWDDASYSLRRLPTDLQSEESVLEWIFIEFTGLCRIGLLRVSPEECTLLWRHIRSTPHALQWYRLYIMNSNSLLP